MRVFLVFLILGGSVLILTRSYSQRNNARFKIKTDTLTAERSVLTTQLEAGFTINLNESTGGVIVTEQSTVTDGSIISWNWSFPGATPSSYIGKTPPVIQYKKAGNYKIILAISDGKRSSVQTKVVNLYNREPALSYTTQPVIWTDNLPIGNGNLGAMTFGNVAVDSFILNEKTVWTGYANDRDKEGAAHLPAIRKKLFNGEYTSAESDIFQYLEGERIGGDGRNAYQPLGRLHVFFGKHKDSLVSNYRRSLDISKAVVNVNYDIGNIAYQREMFAAYKENVIAIKYTATKGTKFSLRLNLGRDGNYNTCKADAIEKTLIMTEHTGIVENPSMGGVKLECMLKLVNTGGEVSVINEKELEISGAQSVIIYVTGATNRFKEDHHERNLAAIRAATRQQYETIKGNHISEYQSYYKRAELTIGNSKAYTLKTTAERIAAIRSGEKDNEMINTFFQYGRYLLISSSRPDNIFPANLQGIWVEKLKSAWNSDYHTNINIQMNYWLAEVTNLSDIHRPMLTYLDSMVRRGKITAQKVFGCTGAVFGHASDIWYLTSPTWGYGVTLWPLGSGWCATHLWEHYQFTMDKQWLRLKGYPVMKEYASFLADYLVTDPRTGKLVSGPSSSPENSFVYDLKNKKNAMACMGPAIDQQIITELFRSCIAATKVLNTDHSFAQRLQQKLDSLAPQQIGSDGRLVEWDKEYPETDLGHRHTSHLWGIYPGNVITQRETPGLFAAARKSFDFRSEHGMNKVEWSSAYAINYYARFKEADLALNQIYDHLKTHLHTNLWDRYGGLFQIDGNLATTAGIAEMLVQSHEGIVELLPALPNDWATGSYKGLCARGGFVLNVLWEKGLLKQVYVFSKAGETLHMLWKDKSLDMPTKAGATYSIALVGDRLVCQ